MESSELRESWLKKLYDFREQGLHISDVNPVSALAEHIEEEIYKGKINADDLQNVINLLSAQIWQKTVKKLRMQTQVENSEKDKAIPELSKVDITKPIYRAMFTAHPVFALRSKASKTLSECADKGLDAVPDKSFFPREKITLVDEHSEVMECIEYARNAVDEINEEIIRQRKKTHPASWQDELPAMLGVGTWVGYDLDGRTDITWRDSLSLRLKEKLYALERYSLGLSKMPLAELSEIVAEIDKEKLATKSDLDRFMMLGEGEEDFIGVVNRLTDTKGRLLSSKRLATKIHEIARQLVDNEAAIKLMVIAADIQEHGFGVGEIHLRVNADQIRNAMRPVDGKMVSVSDGENSPRLLIDKLANRIESESSWEINFVNVERESAVARRQLMLARQFIKYIDEDQKIKLLIAECEKPLTIMSALYLSHKFGVSDALDISPLFETSFGLEHGNKLIEQLLEQPTFLSYLKKRSRLSVQMGFSDAGRFMGQLAANMAIERLQLKILKGLQRKCDSGIDLQIFNTHGESLGRGGSQSTMQSRQHFIMTPFVRHQAAASKIHLQHQSSFQGGDGYRLFGTQNLATASFRAIFKVELNSSDSYTQDDLFYEKTEFSLDLFTALKDWHERLLHDPNYDQLIDLFGSNLLPKTGSRPVKRIVRSGGERRGPSRIRAITHNAILQQLGFLANVISGLGHAATVDLEEFADVYENSPRLRQCTEHALKAKKLGSLNTTLAYCQIVDPGFWVNRAYHGRFPDNQRALRILFSHLRRFPRFRDIQQTVWKFRDDLVDLYGLVQKIKREGVRTTGEQRGELDLLHAIRIALILNSLMIVCKTPRLGETYHQSNDDIITLGLSLDFKAASDIIREAFSQSFEKNFSGEPRERETYSGDVRGNLSAIDKEVLKPLEDNQKVIDQITQLVSLYYGAHG